MGLDDLVPGQPTPGMERKQAIVLDGLWSGTVRTDPGGVSGWHHHGEHDTVAYVVRGLFLVETGEGVVEAGPGEFVHIPPHVVHRESNPTETTRTSCWCAAAPASSSSTSTGRPSSGREPALLGHAPGVDPQLQTARLDLRRVTQESGHLLSDLDSDPEVMRHLTGGAPSLPEDVVREQVVPSCLAYTTAGTASSGCCWRTSAPPAGSSAGSSSAPTRAARTARSSWGTGWPGRPGAGASPPRARRPGWTGRSGTSASRRCSGRRWWSTSPRNA